MKRFAILATLLLPCFCAMAQNEVAPKQMASAVTSTGQISEADFFEVSASKLDAAKAWLKDKPALLLQSQRDIEFFGQKNFRCPAEKWPYLFAVNYQNGGTGSFALERSGSAILVHHASLGPASATQQTALVACLDFRPNQIISHMSGAL